MQSAVIMDGFEFISSTLIHETLYFSKSLFSYILIRKKHVNSIC